MTNLDTGGRVRSSTETSRTVGEQRGPDVSRDRLVKGWAVVMLVLVAAVGRPVRAFASDRFTVFLPSITLGSGWYGLDERASFQNLGVECGMGWAAYRGAFVGVLQVGNEFSELYDRHYHLGVMTGYDFGSLLSMTHWRVTAGIFGEQVQQDLRMKDGYGFDAELLVGLRNAVDVYAHAVLLTSLPGTTTSLEGGVRLNTALFRIIGYRIRTRWR